MNVINERDELKHDLEKAMQTNVELLAETKK